MRRQSKRGSSGPRRALVELFLIVVVCQQKQGMTGSLKQPLCYQRLTSGGAGKTLSGGVRGAAAQRTSKGQASAHNESAASSTSTHLYQPGGQEKHLQAKPGTRSNDSGHDRSFSLRLSGLILCGSREAVRAHRLAQIRSILALRTMEHDNSANEVSRKNATAWQAVPRTGEQSLQSCRPATSPNFPEKRGQRSEASAGEMDMEPQS